MAVLKPKKKAMAVKGKPNALKKAGVRITSEGVDSLSKRKQRVATTNAKTNSPTKASLVTERLAQPMQSLDVKNGYDPKPKPKSQASKPSVLKVASKAVGKAAIKVASKVAGPVGVAVTLAEVASYGIDKVRSSPAGKKAGTANAFNKAGRSKPNASAVDKRKAKTKQSKALTSADVKVKAKKRY